jgi:hypothetical protein
MSSSRQIWLLQLIAVGIRKLLCSFVSSFVVSTGCFALFCEWCARAGFRPVFYEDLDDVAHVLAEVICESRFSP